jgi:hypothetical protein
VTRRMVHSLYEGEEPTSKNSSSQGQSWNEFGGDEEASRPVVSSSGARRVTRISVKLRSPLEEEEEHEEHGEDGVEARSSKRKRSVIIQEDDEEDEDEDEEDDDGRSGRRKRGVEDDDFKIEVENDEDGEEGGGEDTEHIAEGEADSEPESNYRSRRLRRRREFYRDDEYDLRRSLRPRKSSLSNDQQNGRLSRAERAAIRQARYGLDDVDVLGMGEASETEGTTSRRLRPRNTQVDYSRQLHPGSGWAGQPLEAMGAGSSRGGNNRNSIFGRRMGGNGSRRDRYEDDHAINYKPGRYNRTNRFFTDVKHPF